MNKLLLLAAMAASVMSCKNLSSSNRNLHMPPSDLLGENIKGKVQKIETDTYLVDSATGATGKLESKSIEIYNDSGFTTSYNYYLAKDSSNTLYVYVHNTNGFATKVTTTKNGKPLSIMDLVVDSVGKYSLVTTFDSTGKKDMYYDSLKANELYQVVSGKGHHPDGSLKTTFINHYDSVYYMGGESKDSVGKLTFSSSLKRDDRRNVTHMEETNVTKDSTTHAITDYMYAKWDSQGNPTEITIHEKNKKKKIIKCMITYKA